LAGGQNTLPVRSSHLFALQLLHFVEQSWSTPDSPTFTLANAKNVARVGLMSNSSISLKPAKDVSTAAVVATGLIGGWITARETGIRPLGGVILAAAAGYAARTWNAKAGAGVAAGLTTGYIGAFGLSHPLAKKMGSWPAVLSVTAATAGAAYALSDAK